jgi:hypothetical protein
MCRDLLHDQFDQSTWFAVSALRCFWTQLSRRVVGILGGTNCPQIIVSRFLEYIIDFVGKIKLLGLAVISRHHRRNCRLMSALCYLQGGPKEYCPQFEINDIDLSYSLRVISNI